MTYRKIMNMLNQLPIDSPQLDEEATVATCMLFEGKQECATMPITRFSPAIAFSSKVAKEIGDNHLTFVIY